MSDGFRIGELDGVPLVATPIKSPENAGGGKFGPVLLGPLLVDVFPCKRSGFDVRLRDNKQIAASGRGARFYHVDLAIEAVT